MNNLNTKAPNSEEANSSSLLKASERLTLWIGSPASIIFHTLFFIGMFGLVVFDIPVDHILLVLTTAVSLEAIYLAIFIQMTVNQHTQSLEDVEEEIEELGEEVEDLSEDLEEIGEDIDRIQEDEAEEQAAELRTQASLENITKSLQELLKDVEVMKARNDRKNQG